MCCTKEEKHKEVGDTIHETPNALPIGTKQFISFLFHFSFPLFFMSLFLSFSSHFCLIRFLSVILLFYLLKYAKRKRNRTEQEKKYIMDKKMSSISSSSNNNTSNTNAYTNGDDHHLCDESRCISIGFREEQKEDQFFDCYMPRSSIVVTEDEANLKFVDDDMVPIEIAATASFDDGSDLCSKGYAAQLVLNEPFIQRFGVKYAYYTCCIHTTHRQNTEEGDEAVITNSNKKDQIDVYDYSFTRHCSDPKYFANKKITMPCDDINTTRIYPRQMLHMRDYPRSYVW